jgi:hypothetical protein
MLQKHFTTIFRLKKCYFHYDFACKKVPFSLRYAKEVHFWFIFYLLWKSNFEKYVSTNKNELYA